MALAAQFYVSDILPRHAASDHGNSRARQLYATKPQPHHNARNAHGSGDSSFPLANAYLGGQGLLGNYNERHPDLTPDEEELLMTERDRQHFADELAALEQQQNRPWGDSSDDDSSAQPYLQRGPPHESLEAHYDPYLLSSRLVQRRDAPGGPTLWQEPVRGDASSAKEAKRTFFEKNERWKEHLIQKNDLLRSELQSQAQVECTFRPAINRTGSVNRRNGAASIANDGGELVGNASSGLHDETDTRDHVQDRLLRFAETKELRRQMLSAQQLEAEERQCTFRPKTTEGKWLRSITPKYLDPKSPQRTAVRCPADEDFSFKPAVNRVPETQLSAKRAAYLRTSVHNRLHENAKETAIRKQRELDLASASQTRGQRYQVVDTTALSSIGASTLMDASALSESVKSSAKARRRAEVEKELDRQYTEKLNQYKQSKETVVNQLLQEEALQCSFAPAIAEKSRRLAELKKKKEQAYVAKHGTPPPQRHSQERTPQPSFTPRIDKNSEVIARERSVQDLLNYGDKAQNKLMHLQREAIERSEAELTFTPAISEYAHSVPGKIAPHTQSIEAYRRFVAMQRRLRQRDIEQIEREARERADAEMQECTFAPEIHEVPSYIREIVEELKENNRALNSTSHHSSRHNKTDNRNSSAVGAKKTQHHQR